MAASSIRRFFASPRGISSVRVFLAAALTAIAAMVIVKVIAITSVTETDFGATALERELSPGNALGWFAADVWAGLLWGLAMALLTGAALAGPARIAARLALVIAGAGLAGALVISLIVYQLFGTVPTLELLESLDRAADASDSVAALLTGPRLGLGGGLALLLGPVAIALIWAMGRWRRLGLAAAGLVGLVAAAATAGELTGERSRFDLDRNALTAFGKSLVIGSAEAEVGYVPPSRYHDLLRPISAPPIYQVDREAYDKLVEFGRRQPNVVLVLLESTAINQMSIHRPELETTPFLASIADRSLYWPFHHAHTPKSIFAIYQALCSTITDLHGGKPTKDRARVDCRSASELLGANGYTAGLFHSGHHRFSSKDKFFSGRGWDVMHDAHSMPNRDDYFQWSWGIEERASVDAMLGWVDEHRESPVFITYIPVYPHHPYHVPDGRDTFVKVKSRRTVDNYRDSIRYVDGEIERLVRGFEERGLADNTLFIVTGDHGEAFGEHPGSRAHGGKLYTEQVRTFAIWYAPGLFDRRRIDDRPFGHIDLLPTLLDVLGIPGDPRHRGLSALSPVRRPMVPLYTAVGVRYTGFVDGRMKYIYDLRSRRSELFDLAADPDEQVNLAREFPDLTGRYRERARAFKQVAESYWESLPDLEERSFGDVADLPGTDHVWSIDPATDCAGSPGALRVETGVLVPNRTTNAACYSPPLPDADLAITSIDVSGVEARAASWIVVILAWVNADKQRRQIAYCKLNGNPKKTATTCEPTIIAGRDRFRGDGRLMAELRYYTMGELPPPERFALHRIEVGYRVLDENTGNRKPATD